MSNLEASRILASALKDVDEILKVNNYETDEGYDAEINNDRRNILPEISFQDAEGKHCIENLNDCRNLPDETYLYRAGKDFSVLINRLQICINKLNQSTPAASICTSEYQALDFRVTENSSFDIAHPTTTQRTKFNLNLIEQPQQMISQYMFPPNEFSTYLNDKRFHQRITKLRGQVQAQANRIAELEKDGNPLSYMVNKNCTTTGHRNKNISQLISTDMDNLQLLNEVSKQHLRINALEETNRDLEKKINKLEKELSQRPNLFNLRNSYEDLQSLKYNRQCSTIRPTTVSNRSATLSNNISTLNESSRESNRLNYPSIFRRSITPVTFDNRCSFITTPNQPEYNLNFINQSLTGTQSTPPTSRLINDKPYRYDAYIPCEEINKLSFLGENYAHLNSDQFKSASLNELCYSRVMQPVTTTTNINTTTSSNNIVSPNTSKRWLAQNRYSMKSPPADIFNSSIQESGRINLLPPQYGSSYHQHIYNNSRTRSPIPLQWYPYTRNNFIDGGQTSADCQLNGSVNLFNSSGEGDSPSSGRCTTVQDTHLYTSRNKSNLSNAFSSSPSDQQHHMKTVNNSTNILKDEKSLSLSKSTLNGKNQLKRLNIERAFHWLSQGQMNNFTSNGLNKSDSMHHQCKPQNNLNNSALSIRSKSIERYYGSGSMKGSTIRSRRKTQETNLPFVSNSDNHHVDDVPANPVYDSSLPSVLHTNSICNNKSQRSYQGSPLESNENGPLNRNMSVLSKNESCNNNHVKNGPHSSDSYKNTQSDSSSVRHGSDEFTSSYLDNVNKSPSSHNGLNSSSEQRQSFQFAYTKRNFITWDKNMISAWLYKIGLGYTVTHTRRWLTSGQDLVNESKKSLAQLMCIRNPLHLKKLLIHIRLCMKDQCPNNNSNNINNNYNYGCLYRNIEPPENFDMPGWLHDLGLSSYIPQFDNCIIDPYVLDQLTMDDLSVLKMSNELHVLSLRWGLQMLRHINFDRNRLCRSQMEQCEANLPCKRNMLHSPTQLLNHIQDNIKPTNVHNGNRVHTSCLDTISTLQSNSGNSDINFICSTYLPIQICYWTQQRVMNWLQSIELPEYASELCGSGVHGALMILEDRFTPDLLADILRIPQVKSLVRRHLTNKFIELVGLDIWKRKQPNETTNHNNNNNNNPLTIHSKIKFTKKKNIFNSNRGHKSNHYNHVSSVGDDDASTELVCPIEIDASHMSIFAEEVVKPNRQSMHLRAENVPTILIDPVATNVQINENKLFWIRKYDEPKYYPSCYYCY
uniref:SAM domain-containing protein n=1 Tax=Schistosoma mansoni TaxID=6183 RepID=A0A5K4FAW9_SCHMA